MLQTGNEVMGSQLSQFTALGVDPLNAFTDLEGVGQVVLRLSPLGSQSGLHNVLAVVLNQHIQSVADCFGVSAAVSSQQVPSHGVGSVAQGVGILQSVALLNQVGLNPLFVGASALQLSPLCLHLITVSGGDGLSSNHNIVVTGGVVAPSNTGSSVGSNAGDSVVTALGRQGQVNSSLHQLCLSNSHQSITLGNVGSCLSGLQCLVELAQDIHVDSLGQSVVIVTDISVGVNILASGSFIRCLGSSFRCCFGSDDGIVLGSSLFLGAASQHGQSHSQCQNQSKNLLSHFHFPPFNF